MREQQNAPRKCNNEYVGTKKQGRSRYAREDPSKITANTLLRVQALPARFPPKTRYKRATRRATSVQQDKTRYERATRRATSVQQDALRACNRRATSVQHDALHEHNRHAIVCKDDLRRARIRRSSRHGGVTTCSSRYGTKRPFQQDPFIIANTLLRVQDLPARFSTALTLTAKSKRC